MTTLSSSERGGWLMRIERLLGSSLLSWACIALTMSALVDEFWAFLLILIPLANYTVKIDQLHAAMLAEREKRS